MKKNSKANKLIILSIIALIMTISIVIFILNYTKDSSSLSLKEKEWISRNSNETIDVSVFLFCQEHHDLVASADELRHVLRLYWGLL